MFLQSAETGVCLGSLTAEIAAFIGKNESGRRKPRQKLRIEVAGSIKIAISARNFRNFCHTGLFFPPPGV
jgi:hypothetical protein